MISQQKYDLARMVDVNAECMRYVVALTKATSPEPVVVDGMHSHVYLHMLNQRYGADVVDAMVSALFKASRVPG